MNPRTRRRPVVGVLYEDPVGNDVVRTQFLEPFNSMNAGGSDGLKGDVYLLCSIRSVLSASWRRGLNQIRRLLPWVHIRLSPRLPLQLGRITARVAALRICRSPHGSIIHCRGPEAADACSWLKRVRPDLVFVVELRGTGPDEVDFALLWGSKMRRIVGGPALTRAHLASIERVATQVADSLIFMSRSLAELILSRNDFSGHVYVHPCSCSADMSFDLKMRQECRAKRGWTDSLVVLQLGKLSHLYEPTWIACVCEVLRDECGHDVRLVVVTRDPAQAEIQLKPVRRALRDNVEVTEAASADDVRMLMSSADCGLALLRGGVRNEVCLPVKCVDYASNGLPIVSSSVCKSLREMGLGERHLVELPIEVLRSAAEGVDSARKELAAYLRHLPVDDTSRVEGSLLSSPQYEPGKRIAMLERVYSEACVAHVSPSANGEG